MDKPQTEQKGTVNATISVTPAAVKSVINDSPKIKAVVPISAEMIDIKGTGVIFNLDKGEDAKCERISQAVNDLLAKTCATKKNQLEHCSDSKDSGCACSGGHGHNAGAKVDLIVLIDSSGSMTNVASTVSASAGDAIAEAKTACSSDLRVIYMGVDGIWPGTLFLTSHRAYLSGLTSNTLSTDNPVGQYDPEEGANAIEDLSKYFDWREGACRAIFYISDEELDSIQPLGDTANEAAATAAAIASANANKVTVFAHHLTYQNRGPAVINNYKDLCNSTGGKAFFSAAPSKEEYVKLLAEVICSSCVEKCQEVQFPDVKPCISVSWGDSDCDCMETDDLEIMCITVCNCYSNVTFGCLSIGAIIITDSNGKPVASLPDGTPSVQALPLGPICFGDIPPCKDGTPGCVSRELVVRTRGAKSGKYKLQVYGICYGISYHYDMNECFVLELCQD